MGRNAVATHSRSSPTNINFCETNDPADLEQHHNSKELKRSSTTPGSPPRDEQGRQSRRLTPRRQKPFQTSVSICCVDYAYHGLHHAQVIKMYCQRRWPVLFLHPGVPSFRPFQRQVGSGTFTHTTPPVFRRVLKRPNRV